MQFRGVTLQLDDINEVVRLARCAEDARFGIAWAIDTPRSNAFVHMAAMAAATRNLQVGSGIARAFWRGPLQTAAAAADIDRLSHGQCVLGLASGTKRQNLFEVGEAFDHPASRIKELIGILRQVWAMNGDGRLEHDGRFWTLRAWGDTLTKPLRPDIPIFVGAVNDGMLRVAGEVADGLCGHPLYSARYLRDYVWPQIEIGLARAGRSRESFRMTSWLITHISNDRAQARREAAYQIGFYASTRSYSSLLDRLGHADERVAIQRAFHERHDFEAMADAVSDEMVDEMALAGTPDDVRRRLERYDDVLTFPTLYTAGVGPSRTVPQERVRENLRAIIDVFAQ